jgi:hypothetical protein
MLLSKENLCELLDWTEHDLKNWRRRDIFAPNWIVETPGHPSRFAPECLLAAELLADLRGIFPKGSGLPAELVRGVQHTLPLLWEAARDGKPYGKTLRYDGPRGLQIFIPSLEFVERARQKLLPYTTPVVMA